MLVSDSSIKNELLDTNELNLDPLEDEDELVINDSKDEDKDAEVIFDLVSAGEDVFDVVEGFSLGKVSKLAINSLRNSYFSSN